MANNELDSTMLREMFNSIRSAEIKNVKVQKYDDKKMVTLISDYIVKKVEKEGKDED